MTTKLTFVQKAVPTALFCIIGSYWLSRMISGRLDVQSQRTKSRTERQYELEEEHAVVMRNLAEVDEYVNKPVPSAAGPAKA